MEIVYLSPDRTVTVEALKFNQVRRMIDTVNSGKGIDATAQACVDAANNGGSQTTFSEFGDLYTLPEIEQIFAVVAKISGLNLGEPKANL